MRSNEVKHSHLLDLAAPGARPRASSSALQQADIGLLRLMTALDHVPALILGRRGEILATNALFTAVLTDLPLSSSLMRFMFIDPLARERIANWEHFAARSIAALRGELGRRPDDDRLVSLIDDLRANDDDAARWWNDHSVQNYASAAKRILHPIVGELSFDIEPVMAPRVADQILIAYTAQPDSETIRKLPFHASWTLERVTMR